MAKMQFTDAFSSGWATLIVDISESGTSPLTNKGTVAYSMKLKKTSSYAYSSNSGSDVDIILKIGGKTRISKSSFNIVNLGVGKTLTIDSDSFVVEHDENGELNLAVEATFVSGVKLGNAYIKNKTFIGDTIPRASKVGSVTTDVSVGDTVDISLEKLVDGYTHTVTISLGDYSLTQENVDTSASFVIPEEWVNAIPSGEVGTGTITVTTYSDGTQIGTAQTSTFNINVPDTEEYYPVINDVVVADAIESVVNAFDGKYVQQLSRLNVSIDAEGVHGSTVKNYYATLDGVTYITQSFMTNPLVTSGSLELNVKVTDSRGRTAEKTILVEVVPYKAPTISHLTYRHCDEDGTPNTIGTHALLNIRGSVASVEDTNDINLKVKYQIVGTEEIGEQTILVSDWNFDVYAIVPASASHTWVFTAELSDEVSDATTYSIKTGIVVISRKAGGTGVTLFEEALQDGFVVGGGRPTIVNDLTVKGELNLEAGGFGFSSIHLLWQNPDPTVEFEAQTLELDNLSDYDLFYLVCCYKADNSQAITAMIPYGHTYAIFHIANIASSSYKNMYIKRECTIDDNGVTFTDNVNKQNEVAYSPRNSYMIPYRLYGIRGVN